MCHCYCQSCQFDLKNCVLFSLRTINNNDSRDAKKTSPDGSRYSNRQVWKAEILHAYIYSCRWVWTWTRQLKKKRFQLRKNEALKRTKFQNHQEIRRGLEKTLWYRHTTRKHRWPLSALFFMESKSIAPLICFNSFCDLGYKNCYRTCEG